VYALRYPMGGDAGSIELAVPDVRPGETLTLGRGRRLLVLAVVPTLDEDAPVRAILEVEEADSARLNPVLVWAGFLLPREPSPVCRCTVRSPWAARSLALDAPRGVTATACGSAR
jgi:hypothetical protein